MNASVTGDAARTRVAFAGPSLGRGFALAVVALLVLAFAAHAVPAPQPPSGLIARPAHDPAGKRIVLRWNASPDDSAGRGLVSGYALERGPDLAGPWALLDSTAAGVDTLVDARVKQDVGYFYRVVAVGPGGRTPAGACTGPATARPAWWYPTRTRAAIAGVLLLGLGVYLVALGRRRPAPGA